MESMKFYRERLRELLEDNKEVKEHLSRKPTTRHETWLSTMALSLIVLVDHFGILKDKKVTTKEKKKKR